MEQTVKERITEFITLTGISVREFERRSGLSYGYLARLKSSPTIDKTHQMLSAFPELSRTWLLTGEGSMLLGESAAKPAADPLTVPLLPATAFAGGLGAISEPVNLQSYPRVPAIVPTADFAITSSGDSMLPAIPDGAVLYLRKVTESWAIPYGSICVVDPTDGAVVKEISEDPAGLRIHSLNAKYQDRVIPHDQIIGIYRVLALTKFL